MDVHCELDRDRILALDDPKIAALLDHHVVVHGGRPGLGHSPILPVGCHRRWRWPKAAGTARGLLLFIATQQQPWRQDRWRSVLTLILACCAIQSGIGLIQYFLLEPGDLLEFNKTEPTLWDLSAVNVMASFVATGLVLALYLFTAPARSCNHLTSGLALFQIFAAALLLVEIQSRTGQLAGVLGVMLLIPRLLSSGKPQTIVVLAMLALGLIAANLSREVVDQVNRPPSIYEDPGARTTIYAQSAEFREHGRWVLATALDQLAERARQAALPDTSSADSTHSITRTRDLF